MGKEERCWHACSVWRRRSGKRRGERPLWRDRSARGQRAGSISARLMVTPRTGYSPTARGRGAVPSIGTAVGRGMRPPGCPSSPFLPDIGGGTPRLRQDGDRPFPSPFPSLLVWFILEIQKQEKQKSRVATKAKSKFTFFAFIAPASRRVDATRVAAGWGLHAEAGRTRT